MRILVVCIALVLMTPTVQSAERFRDVPRNHWAADAVSMLAKDGVMKGYPDSTYRGNKPVTRYELAVALANMVMFVEKSWKPVGNKRRKTEGKVRQLRLNTAVAFLRNGGFLPKDSKLLKDQSKTVTFNELGQAMSSVAAKLVERHVPAESGE